MKHSAITNYEDLDHSYQVQVARYLAEEVRTGIEQNYYARVKAQAHFENFVNDPAFSEDPGKHIALFSDHGPVHVRDVAKQILHILDTVHGVLIPARSAYRLEFMKGYGVILAYLHDIGMMTGRKMHPEFASQEVFAPAFEGWVATIWNENCGNIAWRLRELADKGALTQDPKIVLLEMLSLANCHSKSKVAVEVLNDTWRLRQLMQITVGMDLVCLHDKQQAEEAHRKLRQAHLDGTGPATLLELEARLQHAERALASHPDPLTITSAANRVAQQHYADFERDSYQWLVSENEAVRILISDVIDTVRALRAADALRQRGTAFKTSAGYQIFIDRTNAHAIFALERENGQTFLLGIDNNLSVGEANVASTEITPHGDMRVAFHRGAFMDAPAIARAAYATAVVIHDVQSDIIESFERPLWTGKDADRPAKAASEMRILLESVDDNLEFTDLVLRELERFQPGLAGRCRTAPSLHNIESHERHRYLRAEMFETDEERRREILEKMAQQGHKTHDINAEHAFEDVRHIWLQAGEILVRGGAPPGFVYIPLTIGLKGMPLGGYESFQVPAWVPLGNTGVIRGDVRNATVTAECSVNVLMIPKEVYFRYWHRIHNAAEFKQLFHRNASENDQAEMEQT